VVFSSVSTSASLVSLSNIKVDTGRNHRRFYSEPNSTIDYTNLHLVISPSYLSQAFKEVRSYGNGEMKMNHESRMYEVRGC
jgi:hypothetical protein